MTFLCVPFVLQLFYTKAPKAAVLKFYGATRTTIGLCSAFPKISRIKLAKDRENTDFSHKILVSTELANWINTKV